MINFRLLRQLWYFSVLAEEQHFRRAATRLGISQPPLTQQIQALEHALKLNLFDRTMRQTTLTPHGAAILPAVRRLLHQAERLEAAVLQARHGKLEHVVIGAVTSAILHLLPSVIAEMKRLHPHAQIDVREMNSSAAWEALERNEIELAIGRYDGPKGAIKVQRLFSDKLDVALPPDHPLTEKDELEITDLIDDNWIFFPRRTNPPNFDRMIAACRAHGFSPRLTHEVTSPLSQIAYVACGIGIALIPRELTPFYRDHVIFRRLRTQIEVVTAAAAWSIDSPLIHKIVSLARGSNRD